MRSRDACSACQISSCVIPAFNAADASGTDCRARNNLLAPGKPTDRPIISRLAADSLSGDDDFGTQTLSLLSCPTCQFPSAETIGKSEIIVDPGCASRLAADRRPFENDGSQSFGGPVYGSAQPSRSRSINRKIIALVFRATKPIKRGSEVANGRPEQHGTFLHDADGNPRIIEPGHTGESPCVVVGFQVDP